ncbi:MAG TPA: NB-ARC domain-containing protein [Anaerolineales bacterium]|nr:NB-ARC domain-containing protein [Anaerolineales bacterium]
MRISLETTAADLYPHLLAALNHWHSSTSDHLLDFLLLVRERAAADGPQTGDPAARRRYTNAVLLDGLEELETRRPEDTRILRMRFIDKQATLQVAFSLDMSEDTVNRRQRGAVLALAEVLLGRELALRKLREAALESRLPSRQYSSLFGAAEALADLAALLAPGNPPWLVALSGMGGIGKTALAHYLALAAVADYGEPAVHWVHVPSQPGSSPDPEAVYLAVLNELASRLTAPEGSPQARRDQARLVLKTRPHLVVIDNLESKSDTAILFERLFGLAEPSKFLLTTRAGIAGTAGVHRHAVQELSFEHAAELIRDYSREIGMGRDAITSESDLQAIYATAGGNPLALRLVVGMAAGGMPLGVVLADLGRRKFAETDEMYDRIYRRAWDTLSGDARELLEGMPLVSETGGASEQLLAFSELPEDRFWIALRELLGRSLLEARGTPSERRYGIHPLTRSFLQTHVLHSE